MNARPNDFYNRISPAFHQSHLIARDTVNTIVDLLATHGLAQSITALQEAITKMAEEVERSESSKGNSCHAHESYVAERCKLDCLKAVYHVVCGLNHTSDWPQACQELIHAKS